MTLRVLGFVLESFPSHPHQNLGLRATSRQRPIAFAPEGSSLDRYWTVNNPGWQYPKFV